jgi:hypothetical protein
MPDELDPKQARQGRSGPRVLIVLIAGLILIGIVWWILHLVAISGPSAENASPGTHPPAGTELNTQPPPPPSERTPQ